MHNNKKGLPWIVGFSQKVSVEEGIKSYLENDGFVDSRSAENNSFLNRRAQVNYLNEENFRNGYSELIDEIYGWKVIYSEKPPFLGNILKQDILNTTEKLVGKSPFQIEQK